jgi:hypothetical protein
MLRRDGTTHRLFYSFNFLAVRGSTDVAAITMAKRICGTADRLDPTRMRGSRDRARRTAPPSPAAVVHEIPQRNPHTPLTAQGCTHPARRPGGWPYSLPADPGRIASSVCSDLISDRHNRGFLRHDRCYGVRIDLHAGLLRHLPLARRCRPEGDNQRGGGVGAGRMSRVTSTDVQQRARVGPHHAAPPSGP